MGKENKNTHHNECEIVWESERTKEAKELKYLEGVSSKHRRESHQLMKNKNNHNHINTVLKTCILEG